jgi:hypothetical protein
MAKDDCNLVDDSTLKYTGREGAALDDESNVFRCVKSP